MVGDQWDLPDIARVTHTPLIGDATQSRFYHHGLDRYVLNTPPVAPTELYACLDEFKRALSRTHCPCQGLAKQVGPLLGLGEFCINDSA